MPAKSKAQQRFFGMVRAAQKGEMASPSSEVSKAAASMSKSDVKKFAKTKHKGLPNKVEEESKKCKEGSYYCYTDKKCKPIPKGFMVDPEGMLRKENGHSVSETTKYDRYDKEKKQFAKADKRMKFGKFYDKAKEAKGRLRPGEVKRYDKALGRYVSNKD